MPNQAIADLLDLAAVTDRDVVCDVGCGKGGVLIEAFVARGARGIGIDVRPELVEDARRDAEAAGAGEAVELLVGDFEDDDDLDRIDWSSVTVVALFLLPRTLSALIPRLRARLRPGTRIVSCSFQLALDEWPPHAVRETVCYYDPKRTDHLYYWEIRASEEP
jgi:SAM-dependent methyltransferase